MSEELKPCPFCGGEAEIVEVMDNPPETIAIQCKSGCGVSAHHKWMDESVLIKRWNTRAERIARIEDSDLPKTSPLPGIPRIRVYDKDGRKCAEGYYVFHERRQPAAYLDELKPEDCAHCVVFDESADWNMPKRMCRKLIVPDGGWVEVVSDAN